MFSEEDLDLFSAEFGKDVPVTLQGIPIGTFKGIDRFEEITSSPDESEIGSSILTLQLKRSDYATLDKAGRYVFTVDGTGYFQRGPHESDGSGFVKIKLTRVRA